MRTKFLREPKLTSLKHTTTNLLFRKFFCLLFQQYNKQTNTTNPGNDFATPQQQQQATNKFHLR